MWLPRALYVIGLAFLGMYYPKFGRYPFYDWFGFLALFGTILVYMSRGQLPSVSRYVVWASLVLMLGVAVTVPNVVSPMEAAFRGVLLIYVVGLWISLPQMLLREWAHLRVALMALGISAAITAFFAVGQRLWGFPAFGPPQVWGREIGLTRQANELGTFCALVFPYVLCLGATSGKQSARWLWGLLGLFGIIGVLLSGSMTGALALFVGVVIYLALTNSRGRMRAGILLFVGAVTFGAVAVGYSNNNTQFVTQRISALVAGGQGRLTLDQRLVANRHAVQDIEANPLQGQGFHSQVKSIGADIQVHNSILLAWHDGGLFTMLGIVIVLVGVGIGLVDASRHVRISGITSYKPYLSAATGAYCAFLVTAQASPILYQRSAWFPVAIALATIMLIRRGSAMVPLRNAREI